MVIDTAIALIVEYNGACYHGSQLQANSITIQEVIESALCKLTGEKTRVKLAGRTDAGAHARGQVVSFKTESSLPTEAFIKGLNHFLPGDIAVKEAFKIDGALDVRRNALSREYKYYILNSPTRSPIRQGFTHLVCEILDTAKMNEACQALIGKHDFASFATHIEIGKKSTVRNIYKAEIEKDGDLVILSMIANAFLPHQVRNTAGALIRVGLGKMTVAEFEKIVQAKTPGSAGPTVPACGLCLMKINYPEPFGGETK